MQYIIIRAYRPSDHAALADLVRQTWHYDRFCPPKTAARLAEVYLNSCLTNQTFIRVAEQKGQPVGVILGKHIPAHRCPLGLRLRWLASVAALCAGRAGRAATKPFACVQAVDDQLLAQAPGDYQGELAFFAIRQS